MKTTISARHCELSDALRDRADEVCNRLAQLSPHALEATVVFDAGFDAGAQVQTVEIRLHSRGRKVLVGVGEGVDHRTALDRAEEKLRPQILKAGRVRQQTRRAPSRDA
jgi:ribosomal subunit interface protein